MCRVVSQVAPLCDFWSVPVVGGHRDYAAVPAFGSLVTKPAVQPSRFLCRRPELAGENRLQRPRELTTGDHVLVWNDTVTHGRNKSKLNNIISDANGWMTVCEVVVMDGL